MKKSIDGITMEMTPIESKNMSYVGYNEETSSLLIEFIRGPVYMYKDVPKDVFEALISSSTSDDYFNENIKNGFRNKRVN